MNASTQLARAVVDGLVAAGIADVVLCPGSRSAPLAYALHAADAAGSLRLHVRHDERSAAFTALGAGVQGRGAAVVTTSGTAVANLHPAVLEAAEAGVPLLVLSADRPARLRGTWANQTTSLQAGLFGAAVRLALDLPAPDPSGAPDAPGTARALTTWRAGVAQAVRAARGDDGGRPGPVHLDLAFDDPLVPDGPVEPTPAGPPPTRSAQPGAGPRSGSWPGAEEVLAAVGAGPARTVVVAGHAAGPLAADLAEAGGWPLLAEPSSGARTGPHAVGPYRLLLASPLRARIERVVVLGRPTLSRPVTRLLDDEGVEVVQLVAHPREPGPGRAVRRVVPGDVVRGSGATAPDDGGGAVAGGWLAAWQRAGAAAARAVDAVLDELAAAGAVSGPWLARELASSLGGSDVLVAAASNAVRDLDLAAAPWRRGGAPLVLAGRGLAGIDGTVSTAAGAALATGRPTRVLVGDLALLHDANGLLLPPGETEPDLRVVVLDDDGGGIFTGLEHGEPERASTFERLFGTPHGVDVGAVAAALGVRVERPGSPRAVRAALAAPVRGRSVVLMRADRTGLRALHARLAEAVAAAVPAAAVPADAGAAGAAGAGGSHLAGHRTPDPSLSP